MSLLSRPRDGPYEKCRWDASRVAWPERAALGITLRGPWTLLTRAPDCASLSTVTSPASPRIEVPEALVSWHRKFFGETGRAWIDALPDLAAGLLDRWQLQPDGAPTCGAWALVLPVVRADATPAVLKLQPITDHTVGEPDALRLSTSGARRSPTSLRALVKVRCYPLLSRRK